MTPVDPVDVESAVWGVARDIEEAVRVVSAAETRATDTARALSLRFAREYLAATGPQQEKRYRAELACEREREDRDIAALAFAHAQRSLRSLETRLSAYQTVARSVTGMYGASGAGRGR